MKPQDVRLYGVDTSKGHRGIFVQAVVQARNSDNLFVTMILEQGIDDEHIRSRRLEMLVPASRLAAPTAEDGVLDQIRNWIGTTEGDGSLVVP